MSDVLEYPDVLQEVRGAMNPGRLKLQSNLVIFKNLKTGRVEQFPSSEVVKAQWLCRARGYCLKLRLENGAIHRFDGFRESEFEKLSPFLSKYYQKDLEKVDLSVRGWNYGVADFVGNSLHFSVHDKLAFEVPLSNVSHATTSKNEVTLEFHQNDDAPVSLMEVRFHIPSSSDNPDKDPVAEFHQNVLEKADIIQATGTAIATVEEIQCLTPRGRYDIKIYPTFLQLHGKTFDYKIPYNTVLRLFLLPHKDGRQMFFAVSLDPPIRQGQTRYPFLILLFNKDEETSLELGLSEEDIQEKYEGKLTKEMSGPMYEIVSRIMKACVNRKITVPGSFIGHSGTHAVGCSYKAATGFLYPLERGFMFVHKPPIHVRFDEVANVNFARSAANTRSFDFEVETKSGTIHTFVNIEKDEYGKLYDFVTSKGLGVKNIGSKKATDAKYDELLDSEDEDEHDVYLERMKQEGKQRAEDEEQDDDEDEDDDDYVAPESGSEVAEEFDTDFTSSSSEDEGGEGDDEKKKEKKEKKKREKEMKTKTVREGPRKKRKKKDKKDPNAPKRPQSAYFLWLNEHREQIKKENPGISITEVSKKAGEMWKIVTDKTEWEEKAVKAKAEYEKAMEAYKASKADEVDDNEDDTSPKAKKSKSPKKSSSSTSKSPKKESKAGAGGEYKSKEFISSSEDSSTDSDDKPLKKKPKTDKEKKQKKEKEKKQKKKESESEKEEEEELPDDEEILSTPPSSGAGSGSESEDDD